VAATNRELRQMVDEGAFRADLFFRLDVFPIHLPALRERPEDVVALTLHLLAAHASRHGVEAPRLAPEAERLLAAQPWPGNVRQLSNVLERVAILHPGERLDEGALAPLLSRPDGEGERERVREALRAADGDKRRAAELLGVSYRTMQRRVRELDLEGYPRYRD
jgi:DNA-binding NtrC family response regulator